MDNLPGETSAEHGDRLHDVFDQVAEPRQGPLDRLEHAIIVTTVLAQLSNLDGRPRALTPSGTERDVAVAELVFMTRRPA